MATELKTLILFVALAEMHENIIGVHYVCFCFWTEIIRKMELHITFCNDELILMRKAVIASITIL